jgi:hypothetical protein
MEVDPEPFDAMEVAPEPLAASETRFGPPDLTAHTCVTVTSADEGDDRQIIVDLTVNGERCIAASVITNNISQLRTLIKRAWGDWPQPGALDGFAQEFVSRAGSTLPWGNPLFSGTWEAGVRDILHDAEFSRTYDTGIGIGIGISEYGEMDEDTARAMRQAEYRRHHKRRAFAIIATAALDAAARGVSADKIRRDRNRAEEGYKVPPSDRTRDSDDASGRLTCDASSIQSFVDIPNQVGAIQAISDWQGAHARRHFEPRGAVMSMLAYPGFCRKSDKLAYKIETKFEGIPGDAYDTRRMLDAKLSQHLPTNEMWLPGVPKLTANPQWLNARVGSLTATSVARILETGPHGDYVNKRDSVAAMGRIRGNLKDYLIKPPFHGNAYTTIGIHLEDRVRDRVIAHIQMSDPTLNGMELGLVRLPNSDNQQPDCDVMSASPDCAIVRTSIVDGVPARTIVGLLEIKTSTQRLTDNRPKSLQHLIQMLVQAFVLGVRRIWYAYYEWPTGKLTLLTCVAPWTDDQWRDNLWTPVTHLCAAIRGDVVAANDTEHGWRVADRLQPFAINTRALISGLRIAKAEVLPTADNIYPDAIRLARVIWDHDPPRRGGEVVPFTSVPGVPKPPPPVTILVRAMKTPGTFDVELKRGPHLESCLTYSVADSIMNVRNLHAGPGDAEAVHKLLDRAVVHALETVFDLRSVNIKVKSDNPVRPALASYGLIEEALTPPWSRYPMTAGWYIRHRQRPRHPVA